MTCGVKFGYKSCS